MRAFTALHRATTRPAVLDTKTKERMALAIGAAMRCDGCVALHTPDAPRAGATAAMMETLGSRC
jgi:AhpD family alkylhydroperoxidase